MTLPGGLQLAMNLPAAIGSELTATRRGGLSAAPRYGMTMWFQVLVKSPVGTEDLGRWSGCSGLDVSFDVEEVWSGGEYDAPYYVPKAITYGRITLERAMEQGSSATVRAWLAKVADSWINSPDGGSALLDVPANSAPVAGGHRAKSAYSGTSVTVVLFSAVADAADQQAAREVARWELSQAVPVSWSGPALSSRNGDVAVEKLVLAHRGFLGAAQSAGNSPGHGKFTISHKQEVLAFQYNPDKVTLEKAHTTQDPHAMTFNSASDMREFNKLNVTLNDLHIEGVAAVREKCQKLWAWLELTEAGPAAAGAPPKPQPPDQEGSAKLVAEPKLLKLSMGSGEGAITVDSVYLKSVKVNYTRFTPDGVPSRAQVTLTVVVAAESSPVAAGGAGAGAGPAAAAGGLAGGGKGAPHTMNAGESLPQAAAAQGGGGWRAAAARNNIDDPMRVRAGTKVSL